MAIKKRTPAPLTPEQESAIAAFGDAADAPAEPPKRSEPAPDRKPAPRSDAPQSATAADLPSTMLIRFPDDKRLAALIQAIHEVDNRSKHVVALRALDRGLTGYARELGIKLP